MIYFIAHTFKCVCHCRRAMFRVLGMYNFGLYLPLLSCRNSVERVVSLKKVGNLLSHDLSAYIFFLFMVMHRAQVRGTVCVPVLVEV